MDYRSSLGRMGVADRLFKCDTAIWLETALPESFVKEFIVSRSFLESIVQSLSQETDPPQAVLGDWHGFHQFRRLFQMEVEVPDDLFLQAINSTVTSVLQAAEKFNLREYGYTRPISEGNSVFQYLLYDSGDQLHPGFKDDGVSVLVFSVEAHAEAIEKSKCLLTIGANEMMSQNPCRRYVYGLSLDRCMATFWRFDRLSILTSESFNFQEMPHFLVHMILFLGFATSEQLGLDSTVNPVEREDGEKYGPDQSSSYVYHLGGRRYRTIGRPMYDNPATVLCSHGTRVWTVREVDKSDSWLPGTTQHVLKDFWADEHQPRESECQTAIRDRLRLLDTDGGHRAEEINEYFLSIRHEDDIVFNGQLDATLAMPDSAMRDDSWTGSKPYAHHYWRDYGTSSGYDSHPGESSLPRSPCRRIHRRLLFEQKCNHLTDLTELAVILNCFKQFSRALNLFRQGAYVHRDISIGNCLVYNQNGAYRAMICDLEFCEDYASISPTDPVMGTREFMATETVEKCLAWCTLLSNDQPNYHYHFLHDLESLYWLLLWIILGREPTACTLDPTDKIYRIWRDEFRRLFSASDRSRDVTRIYLSRRLFMLDNSAQSFISWSRVFLKQNLPSVDLFRPIFDFKHEWLATYTELERTQQDPVTGLWPATCFTADLYDKFGEMVDQVIAGIPGAGCKPVLYCRSCVYITKRMYGSNSESGISK